MSDNETQSNLNGKPINKLLRAAFLAGSAAGLDSARREAESQAKDGKVCADEAMKKNFHELADYARGWRGAMDHMILFLSQK